MNGKKVDLLIDDVFLPNIETGIREFFLLKVWADPGKKDVIKAVEGVANVVALGATEYHVYLDPRYERDFVKAEIEAAIKCSED